MLNLLPFLQDNQRASPLTSRLSDRLRSRLRSHRFGQVVNPPLSPLQILPADPLTVPLGSLSAILLSFLLVSLQVIQRRSQALSRLRSLLLNRFVSPPVNHLEFLLKLLPASLLVIPVPSLPVVRSARPPLRPLASPSANPPLSPVESLRGSPPASHLGNPVLNPRTSPQDSLAGNQPGNPPASPPGNHFVVPQLNPHSALFVTQPINPVLSPLVNRPGDPQFSQRGSLQGNRRLSPAVNQPLNLQDSPPRSLPLHQPVIPAVSPPCSPCLLPLVILLASPLLFLRCNLFLDPPVDQALCLLVLRPVNPRVVPPHLHPVSLLLYHLSVRRLSRREDLLSSPPLGPPDSLHGNRVRFPVDSPPLNPRDSLQVSRPLSLEIGPLHSPLRNLLVAPLSNQRDCRVFGLPNSLPFRQLRNPPLLLPLNLPPLRQLSLPGSQVLCPLKGLNQMCCGRSNCKRCCR